MKLRVRLDLTVESDAPWIPADRDHGVAAEAEELIVESIENCMDGVIVNVIGIKVDDR